MVPPFDLQGGLPLAVARAATVTALLSLFGTQTFQTLVAPKAYARMAPREIGVTRRRLHNLTLISLLGAALATAVWLVLESGHFADAATPAEALAAIWPVLTETFFGHVIAAQLAVLAVFAVIQISEGKKPAGDALPPPDHQPLLRRGGPGRGGLSLALATLAILLQAGHSHAYSMYGGLSLLLAADILHLLGAGAWLGGLIPLILLVHTAPPKAGATAARWFSPMGQWCIAALAVSAAYQGWVLVASIPGLLGTAYGWLVLVKLLLSIVLLGFAAANRYRFAPPLAHAALAPATLAHAAPGRARRVLIRSITVQTGFAFAIVIAAAILSGLPPSMHEQALWPFPQRFSLATINEDPDFRREVLEAAAALGVAAIILLAALLRRRFRLPAAAAAAVVAWFAIPHFDLLLVQAYPTSFYHSPTGFASASIVGGATVFARNCTACHGQGGQGDGPAAKSLPVPPADLTAAHLWMHSDGELYWWVSHGIETPEGQQAMPGFAPALDDDRIWAVIDYIHANNAGTLMRNTGHFPPAVRAPGFGATCGGAHPKLADFRGKYVRLVFGAPPGTPSPADTVTVAAATGASPMPSGTCVIRDETVAAAYAIVGGISPQNLPGTQFLIDSDGWLRAMQPSGAQPGWNTPARLATVIASLRAHPVASSGGMQPMAMSMPMNMPMQNRKPAEARMTMPLPMTTPMPTPTPMPMPGDNK